MRFNRWAVILIAVLAACETVSFAYQKVDLSGIKPRNKQEQTVQVEFISPEELKAKIAGNEPLAIVDLRSQASYEQSDQTIRGSFHTKVRKVASRLRTEPRDKEVVTYCACPSDEAAIIAARSLLANGFQRVRVLKGGWNAWLQAGGQMQPRPKP